MSDAKIILSAEDRTLAAFRSVRNNLLALTPNTQKLREQVLSLGQSLSGTAALLALFAKHGSDNERVLQAVSLGLSAAGTAARAFGAIVRTVTLTLGGVVTVMATLVAAVVGLVVYWDAAKAAAIRIWGAIGEFLIKLWGGLAEAAGGLGEILRGAFALNVNQIRSGWGQLQAGLSDVGNTIAKTTTDGVSKAKKAIMDLLGPTPDEFARAMAELRRTREEAETASVNDEQEKAARRVQIVYQEMQAKIALSRLSAKQRMQAEQELLATMNAVSAREFEAARGPMGKLMRDWENVTKQMQQGTARWAQASGDALTEFAMNGQLNF